MLGLLVLDAARVWQPPPRGAVLTQFPVVPALTFVLDKQVFTAPPRPSRRLEFFVHWMQSFVVIGVFVKLKCERAES